jgi:WD40 repeat protein
MSVCPSREQLRRLLADELSEAGEQALDAHVTRCPRCLKALEELTGVGESLSPFLPGSLPASAATAAEPSGAFLARMLARSSYDDTKTNGDRAASSHRVPEIDGYEILGKLGHGGMGVVYMARQLDLQRTIALKMVLGGVHADPHSLSRFHAEAEAAAQLQHPNIVQIYAVGEADGLPYYSLEYVEGGTLAQHVSGSPVSPRRAAELVEVLARAVQYAHARGIVHRDLKPANILLTPEGAPKITDFGLAKRFESNGDWSAPTTGLGLAAGTPRYMAPEQLSPLAPGKKRLAGPPSDIYALGAILYELLTGRPLYTGDSALDVVVRVLHEDPTPPHLYRPGLPRDLETIALKCLSKNPARRYATARELADDLQRFLLGQPVLAQPPSLLYRAGKFIGRNKTLVGAAVAVAAALTAGIVGTSIAAFREATQRRIADLNFQNAERARKQAILVAYQARLAAASAALGDHNVGEAASQLNAAPSEQRGWEWRHVSSRLDDSVSSVRPPGTHHLLFEDGRKVASITDQGIGIRDLVTGVALRTIAWDGPQFLAGATTRVGSMLITHRNRGAVVVLTETGNELQRFAIPEKYYDHAFAIDHSGTWLARSGRRHGGEEELSIFDLRNGSTLTRCADPRGELRCLEFSRDGRFLAGGGDDRMVQLWDASSGASVALLSGHQGFVLNVVFSPDGRRILSCSADGTFRQWDIATGKLLDERYGHDDPVNAVAYSPDGAWIISGGADGTVRYWSSSGGPAMSVLHGHTSPVTRVAVSFDGQQVVSVALDGSVRTFDGPGRGDARVLRGHTSFVYPVAYSPDGRLIASGGWDNVVRLWDAATGSPGAELRGHIQYVASLMFSPDSRRLVTRSADGTLRVWDTTTGKELALVKHGFVGMADTPHLVAVTPDGTRVACAGDDRLCFWELESGREAGTLPLPSKDSRMAVFRPDGKQLASTGAGSDIYLVDTRTGKVQARLRGHQRRVHGLNYSHDGRHLVSAGEDRDVRIWDTTTGQSLRVLRKHTGAVFAAVFHPDGSRIASAGRDRVIRIWDAATGAELARLAGHTAYVFSLEFSPDGTSLASGSGDYTVRLWDTFPVARRLQKRATASRDGGSP